MTREEVIANVEAKIKRIKHIMDEGDYGCVDIENWEHWAKQLEYQEIILAALRDAGTAGCGRMTLGSLFDGSGGFPLAGAMHGITPVWASEIEPYPIRVTKARFPQMKHLGSVLDVNGAEVEPVDIITFGSPCQDLSVAGKQAGLHKGERSNLFFEAIRIIKEMRESTDGKYPRIAVWENVPGAYSSNKGEDFRAVLEAFVQINDETANVPRPAAGKWHPAGAIVGNGWSVAWRTFDAQYWGVPQRRKRIYLIADFGSERAGEVLFEQDRGPRDSAACGEAGKGAAGDAEGSPRGGRECLTPWDVQSRRVHDDSGAWPAIYGGEGGGHGYVLRQATPADAQGRAGRSGVDGIFFKERAGCPGGGKGILCGDKPFTLSTMTDQAVCYAVQACGDRNNPSVSVSDTAYCIPANPMSDRGQAVCYPIDSHQQDSRFRVCDDGIAPTLPGQMGTGRNNGPMVLETYTASNGQMNQPLLKEQARTLDCMHDHQIVIKPSKPPRKYIIRRLTPLECVRLQGLPDWWLDGVDGSDSAKYKMLGNGIAMPNAIYVVGCAVQLLQEGKHEKEG